MPRVGQHHHEGHQRPARATDDELAEVRPVDLSLFARQGAQAQIRLGRRPRPVARDDGAEVIGGARIAALAHHAIQAARAQRRIALEASPG